MVMYLFRCGFVARLDAWFELPPVHVHSSPPCLRGGHFHLLIQDGARVIAHTLQLDVHSDDVLFLTTRPPSSSRGAPRDAVPQRTPSITHPLMIVWTIVLDNRVEIVWKVLHLKHRYHKTVSGNGNTFRWRCKCDRNYPAVKMTPSDWLTQHARPRRSL